MKRLALTAVAALLLASCHPLPFSTGAWVNTQAGSAYSHPNAYSGAWVGELDNSQAVADVTEYGVPVYQATSGTPHVTIHCSASWCQDNGRSMPMPAGARPSTGSDGAMAVWDTDANVTYDLWQVTSIGSSAVYSSDASHSCTDPQNSACQGNDVTITGSGISRLAGVVTAADLGDSDGIGHALVFSSRDVDGAACNSYVWPATKSDACNFNYPTPSPIPEGTRFVLDPAYSVPTSLPAWQQAVLHALQDYGAYVIDNGGADAAFIFSPDTGLGDYASVPVPWAHVHAA